MSKPTSELSLQQAIDRLRKQQLPVRDLWPGIAHAINEPAPSPWPRYGALAASVLIVLCASLYFGRVLPERAAGSLDPGMIAMLQNEHQQNLRALMVEYQGQPPLYSDWETQMQELERAETVIYNALREEPDNLELLKILRQVQQKQLNLIDSVFSPRLNSI